MPASIQAETPRELFKELVEQAIGRRPVDASESSVFYLVSLLDDFVRPERRARRAGLESESTLAELLCRALDAAGPRRLALFRYAGDQALFVSGFFAPSLKRQPIELEYYIRMGERAYGGAAASAQEPAAASLFDELAVEFAGFVDVLGEVSESCAVRDESNLLWLYESWLATGNPRTAAVLREAGVVLDPAGHRLPS